MRLPSARPSLEEQKKIIEDYVLASGTAVAGETWYIISKRWFKDWENYVQGGTDGDADAPGPIDNSPLINGDNSLRRGLEEYRDYELVPEPAWNSLYQWYQGGPPMARQVVLLRSRIIVEIRPLQVQVRHKVHGVVDLTVSKGSTISSLVSTIASRWGLEASGLTVWDQAGQQVTDTNQQLADLHVADGARIDVEDDRVTLGDAPSSSSSSSSEDTNGSEDSSSVPLQESSTYPSTSSSSYSYSPLSSYSSSSSSSSSSSYSYSSYYDKPKQPPPPGIVGLSNLGNTCFMNSSLQCLSNTVPLAEFFLSGAYSADVNLTNPLGTQGKLAEEFARLVRELWNGRNSSVAPRDFKSRLERFAPQFTGYQQHDSQELLAFLLDGLHEDLNRVKKKLYAEVREGDDIPDAVRAKEAWDIHKNRNDSVVVDWFQAALKSTLVCPTCSRVSVTFDPYMYLSLPLPMKSERDVPITLVVLDTDKPPTKYLVTVPKSASIGGLKAKLGEMAGVPADCLIITDVFNCKFFKKFNDGEGIDTFDEERDVLYAYEVRPQPSQGSDKLIHCAIYCRRDEARSLSYPHAAPSTQLFGTPFFVSIPAEITYRQLYTTIKDAFARWLKKDIPLPSPTDQNNTNENSSGSQTEEEDGSQNGDSQRISSEDGQAGQQAGQLFGMYSVDSHGYHETMLVDKGDDIPVDLEARSTVAVHWKAEYLHYLEDMKYSVHHSSMHSSGHGPDAITLDRCLALYTTTERLGPDDPWYCNRCKEHKQATKKFDLWSAPRILVVHLKRFSYRNKYFREKLETLVECPLRGLDLSPHIIGPADTRPVYDLYAVSNHYGSLGGGHYTAYALNKSTQKWYKFDDSHVSEVDESQVVSSSAYVLFYRRRDTADLSSVPASIQQPSTTNNQREQEASDEEGADEPVSLPKMGSSMDLD